VNVRFAVCAFALLLTVTGCHADVTLRLDLHRNGTASASTREVLDDQLYQLALSQDTSGDPFGAERLKREGWSVSQSSDENASHTIVATKLLTTHGVSDIGSTAPLFRGASLPLTSLELSRSPGLFSENDSLSGTVPSLLPIAESALGRPYSGLAAALFSSVVALHLELRTPGSVLDTNGETRADGFVRWNLSLQGPTKIAYTVRLIRYDRIALVLLTAFIGLIVLVSIVARNRKAAATHHSRGSG